MTTTYTQQTILLPSLGRGSHLITPSILSSLAPPSQASISDIKHGLLHLFLQHTSCALTLNENWDADVRADMSDALDGIVVEDKVRFIEVYSRPAGSWLGRGREGGSKTRKPNGGDEFLQRDLELGQGKLDDKRGKKKEPA